MKLWWGLALASGPLALGLWFLAGLTPSTVENWYSRGLYPLMMGPWSRLVGLIPFPVAPLLLFALLIGAVASFFFVPPLKALSWLGAGLSVLVAWFVLGWGLNYQRQSWATTHHLSLTGGTVAELETLAQRLATGANTLRAELPVAAPRHAQDWPILVSQAWERAGEGDKLLAGRYGKPKAFGTFDALSWVGIAGICIPHTGEPLVNTGPNDWQLPFVAAHEAAHLRGWAREDEANFLAFWVLRDDPSPALAYSAWSSALLYVARALQDAGPLGLEAWSRVAEGLSPEVRDDWKNSFAYWERFRGPAARVSRAVNDLYLKSQGQEDGIKSYGRMVDLLLSWGNAGPPAKR